MRVALSAAIDCQEALVGSLGGRLLQVGRALSSFTAPCYTGFMSESDKPLREQIDEGMAAIRHQLERLREGPTMGEPPDDRTVIAALEAEYQALKETRIGLGPHDHGLDELNRETHD